MIPEAQAVAPRIIPANWMQVDQAEDGAFYRHRFRPLTLIWSVQQEPDGRWWQHLSVSAGTRTPTWDELIGAKEWVMGTDAYAYQVAPPRSVYVNLNPTVLHLFRLLDGDGRVLPEFSAPTTAGGRTL